MSEQQPEAIDKGGEASPPLPPAPVGPENQRERWFKYGANVALASLLVVALAAVVIWATNVKDLRLGKRSIDLRGQLDLTGDASQSLKPQTVDLLRDLNAKVTLVSLYPKLKKEEAAARGDTYQKVLDALEQYGKASKNIDVQAIDFVAEPIKLDGWLGELKRKYGNNIGAYEDWLKAVPKSTEEIKKLAKVESDTLDKLGEMVGKELDLSKLTREQQVKVGNALNGVASTVATFPPTLDVVNEMASEELKRKIPDYETAANNIKTTLTQFTSVIDRLTKRLEPLRDDASLPEPLRKYCGEAIPRFAAIMKPANEVLEKAKALTPLKLDEVRKKLIPPNEEDPPRPAIAVMGENDIKIIDDAALWKSGESTGLTGVGAEKPKLRFAGEQQITSAILALQSPKKQKLAFIRPGGPPRTTMSFSQRGPIEPRLGLMAERLRDYNFDVIEKDISETWAMQAMQMGMPPAPEPSPEDLKSAIWVVLSEPSQQQPQMGMPPPPSQMGAKLKEHLDGGGSAIVLANLEAEDLSPSLKEWGIEISNSAVAVHEPIVAGNDAPPADFIEQARRVPYIFILNEYGDHAITRNLRSLDAAILPIIPVKKIGGGDATVTELLPVPQQPASWGETDRSFLFSRRAEPPTFDKDADLPGPLFGAAAAERPGKGRLVVIGAGPLIEDNFLSITDPKLEKSNVRVSRFPGNGELFTNSLFWLAKNEKMIALSPAAMDAARIESIKPGMLAFWRIGVFLVGMPSLAIAAGIMVWQTRRA